MVPGWKLDEILPTLAVKSAKYITEQSKKDKPFFLYVPLTSPHTPIAPSKAFIGKSGISKYADFVIETDWVVGHIAEAIDKAGIAFVSKHFSEVSGLNQQDLEGELACILR